MNVNSRITQGDILESKFKLSYETIINLLNSDILTVQEMMRRSYRENERHANFPSNVRRIKYLKSQFRETHNLKCIKQEIPPIEDYSLNGQNMNMYSSAYFSTARYQISKQMKVPLFCVFFDQKYHFYLGMIVSIEPTNDNKNNRFLRVLHLEGIDEVVQPVFEFDEDQYEYKVVENHHYCDEITDQHYIYKIFRLSLSEIVKIYADDTLVTSNPYFNSSKYYSECLHSLFSKIKDFRQHFLSETQTNLRPERKEFTDLELQTTHLSKQVLNKNLDDFYNSPCHACELRSVHLEQIQKRAEIKSEMKILFNNISVNNLNDQSSFENKLDLLQELKYINGFDNQTVKAKVAKEVQNIYVAEILMQSFLDNLLEQEIVSLLSGFVCQGNMNGNRYDPIQDDLLTTDNFSRYLDSYKNMIRQTISTIQSEINNQAVIASSAEEYLKENVYNTDLMLVVYYWMMGSDFYNICQMTTYQEGGIVKCFLRLENLLKNIRNSYILLGNYHMSTKIESSMVILKKDIIFSKSLYLDQDF